MYIKYNCEIYEETKYHIPKTLLKMRYVNENIKNYK